MIVMTVALPGALVHRPRPRMTTFLCPPQIKTMLPGEHQQVISNLQSHFEDFLEDSEESEVFTVADRSQLEREIGRASCRERV